MYMGSNLFYNKSVRHKQHECNTSETQAKQMRYDWDTSESCDFNNDASQDVFSHPYINYMANEILKKERQFHPKN